MKKHVAACAALACLALSGGTVAAGSGDYPISGGGGDPECDVNGGGSVGGESGSVNDTPAGETDAGCWSPPADPGDPAPGNPVPGVSSRPPAPQQELPATGTDNGDLVRIGGVSLVAGLGLVAVARRRRQSVVA